MCDGELLRAGCDGELGVMESCSFYSNGLAI